MIDIKLIKTKTQLTADKLPTKLEFSEILFNRGHLDVQSYQRLYKGEKGERILLEYLQKYGQEHWQVVRNIWLHFGGNFECDLLLFTRHKLYVFEVKYYNGQFCYENASCSINKQALDTNCIEQTRRLATKIAQLFKNYPQSPSVTYVNAFTSPDNEVIIKDTLHHTQVVPLYRLQRFIQQIAFEESRYQGQAIDPAAVITHLDSFALPQDPFLPKALSQKEIRNLKSGIYCKACHSYHLHVSKSWIICTCGHKEKREQAIVRTICEYGVLTYGRAMQIGELYIFLAKQLSMHYLRKILRGNFAVIGKGRCTVYENKQISFARLYEKENEAIKMLSK